MVHIAGLLEIKLKCSTAPPAFGIGWVQSPRFSDQDIQAQRGTSKLGGFQTPFAATKKTHPCASQMFSFPNRCGELLVDRYLIALLPLSAGRIWAADPHSPLQKHGCSALIALVAYGVTTLGFLP